VEEGNKTKSQTIQGKGLAARRPPSGDVVITTDTEETKTQLEKDGSWLAAVGQAAQVNCRKSPVMVHGMKVSSVDYSNQRETIRRIMGRNAQRGQPGGVREAGIIDAWYVTVGCGGDSRRSTTRRRGARVLLSHRMVLKG
jgi:hypothetical protein